MKLEPFCEIPDTVDAGTVDIFEWNEAEVLTFFDITKHYLYMVKIKRRF